MDEAAALGMLVYVMQAESGRLDPALVRGVFDKCSEGLRSDDFHERQRSVALAATLLGVRPALDGSDLAGPWRQEPYAKLAEALVDGVRCVLPPPSGASFSFRRYLRYNVDPWICGLSLSGPVLSQSFSFRPHARACQQSERGCERGRRVGAVQRVDAGRSHCHVRRAARCTRHSLDLPPPPGHLASPSAV